jgi:hypothetical protein
VAFGSPSRGGGLGSRSRRTSLVAGRRSGSAGPRLPSSAAGRLAHRGFLGPLSGLVAGQGLG